MPRLVVVSGSKVVSLVPAIRPFFRRRTTRRPRTRSRKAISLKGQANVRDRPGARKDASISTLEPGILKVYLPLPLSVSLISFPFLSVTIRSPSS